MMCLGVGKPTTFSDKRRPYGKNPGRRPPRPEARNAILADSMRNEQIRSDLEHLWDRSIVPTLEEYIRIPNQSPVFDPDWKKKGHMNAAVDLARRWAEQQGIAGMRLEVHE